MNASIVRAIVQDQPKIIRVITPGPPGPKGDPGEGKYIFVDFGMSQSQIQAALDQGVTENRPVVFMPGAHQASGLVAGDIEIEGYDADTTSIVRPAGSTDISVLTFTGAKGRVKDITFDANRDANSNPADCVVAAASVLNFTSDSCVYRGGAGVSNGRGLVITGGAAGDAGYQLRDNDFVFNDRSGLVTSDADNMSIIGNRAHDNGNHGFDLNNFDTAFVQKIYYGIIADNHAWDNVAAGFRIGNFNEDNVIPNFDYGVGNPEVIAMVVSGNVARSNGTYGFGIQGQSIAATGNQAFGNANGILFNCSHSSLVGNIAGINTFFGIDAGWASNCVISGNVCSTNQTGINAASTRSSIVGNYLRQNSLKGINLQGGDSDGAYRGSLQVFEKVTISGNTVEYPSGALGIYATDRFPNSVIANNTLIPSAATAFEAQRALIVISDSITVRANKLIGGWGEAVTVAANKCVVPDVLESAALTTPGGPTINDLRYYSQEFVGDGGLAWMTVGGAPQDGSGFGSGYAVHARAAAKTITGIALGAVTTIISASHGYANGDVVRLAQIGGTTQLNEGYYTIQNVTANSYDIPVNSSGFGAYTSGGTSQKITGTYIAITDTGTGLNASAYPVVHVKSGAIVGARVETFGTGYSSGTIQATIRQTGAAQGSGATIAAQVGLPLLNGRFLDIYYSTVTTDPPATFTRLGKFTIDSPSNDNLKIPPKGWLRLHTDFARWNSSSSQEVNRINRKTTGETEILASSDIILSPTGFLKMNMPISPAGNPAVFSPSHYLRIKDAGGTTYLIPVAANAW